MNPKKAKFRHFFSSFPTLQIFLYNDTNIALESWILWSIKTKIMSKLQFFNPNPSRYTFPPQCWWNPWNCTSGATYSHFFKLSGWNNKGVNKLLDLKIWKDYHVMGPRYEGLHEISYLGNAGWLETYVTPSDSHNQHKEWRKCQWNHHNSAN